MQYNESPIELRSHHPPVLTGILSAILLVAIIAVLIYEGIVVPQSQAKPQHLCALETLDF